VPRRPPRLAAGHYIGLNAYFLTAITHHRQPAFRVDNVARDVIGQLLQCAAQFDFVVPAYCLMPDHAHVLFKAQAATCNFLDCAASWRGRTASTWKRMAGTRLWQEGYWDRILRSDDDERCCAAYIVSNPVRAGLVNSVADYPFVGSTEYSLAALAEVPLDVQLAAAARFGPTHAPRQ
jgi:REP element-mobilizing transposase RayT